VYTDKNVIETCSFRDEDDDCTYHYTVNYPSNNTDKEHRVLVKKKKGEKTPKSPFFNTVFFHLGGL